jgi:hypothetical protein
MDPFIPKSKLGPEAIIEKKATYNLRARGWFVKKCHGNEFQSGFPDNFACHRMYGSRWIEFKCPTGSRLEESQVKTFERFGEKKVGVWVLTSFENNELDKLLKPYNWYQYLDTFKVVTRSRERKEKEERESRKGSSGPEREIQEAIKTALTEQGWYCKDTHGNIYSYGFPDIYACHREWGARWIEVKNPRGYVFTPSQLETFPLMWAHGCGVWVLTSPEEIPKLFKPANWYQYLDVMKV